MTRRVGILINQPRSEYPPAEIALFLWKFNGDDIACLRRDPPLHGLTVQLDQVLLFQLGHQTGGKGEIGAHQLFDGTFGFSIFFGYDVLKLRHGVFLFL